jgi:hypothetical protein
MGQTMNRYGVNFLLTTREGDFVPGTLGSGFSISAQHDNQLVPFVSVKRGQLVKVN